MESEGIYLLREREFIRMNENIYKIGRSKHIKTRMNSYPKGSVIELMIGCSNSIQSEKDLLAIFKTKYKQLKDYGAEYFEGDKLDMIATITTYLNTQTQTQTQSQSPRNTQPAACSLYNEQPTSELYINDMKIVENAGCLFWMDKNNYNVYEITSDNGIGQCVGQYDTNRGLIIN
jgi:hypothetical protein